MAADPRLKGQEVAVRLVQGGQVVSEINSIGSFNDNTALRLLEDGFLGEPTNRFDEVLDGFGGDMEIQVSKARWQAFQEAILKRARRETPAVVFNVIRTDLFANGESNIYTYMNVAWGAQPAAVASRGDFVKVRMEFRCSERPVQTNALP